MPQNQSTGKSKQKSPSNLLKKRVNISPSSDQLNPSKLKRQRKNDERDENVEKRLGELEKQVNYNSQHIQNFQKIIVEGFKETLKKIQEQIMDDENQDVTSEEQSVSEKKNAESERSVEIAKIKPKSAKQNRNKKDFKNTIQHENEKKVSAVKDEEARLSSGTQSEIEKDDIIEEILSKSQKSKDSYLQKLDAPDFQISNLSEVLEEYSNLKQKKDKKVNSKKLSLESRYEIIKKIRKEGRKYKKFSDKQLLLISDPELFIQLSEKPMRLQVEYFKQHEIFKESNFTAPTLVELYKIFGLNHVPKQAGRRKNQEPISDKDEKSKKKIDTKESKSDSKNDSNKSQKSEKK